MDSFFTLELGKTIQRKGEGFKASITLKMAPTENTNLKEKYHCTDDLLFYWVGFEASVS